MKNSCVAQVTLGVLSGYNVDTNKFPEFKTFCKELQKFETENFSDEFVSWLVTPANTVYKVDWGSPIGGEPVYVLQASYTEYDADNDVNMTAWKRRILTHATALMKHYKQSTVRVQFTDADVFILR